MPQSQRLDCHHLLASASSLTQQLSCLSSRLHQLPASVCLLSVIVRVVGRLVEHVFASTLEQPPCDRYVP